jgi:hypothetical protein
MDEYLEEDLSSNQKNLAGDEKEEDLSADEEKLRDELGLFGSTRRQFFGTSAVAVLGAFAYDLLAKQEALGNGSGPCSRFGLERQARKRRSRCHEYQRLEPAPGH